jgi:hypothetical protein
MRVLIAEGRLWSSRIRPPALARALGGSLVFADKAAKDGPALDPLLGEVRDRVIGPVGTRSL